MWNEKDHPRDGLGRFVEKVVRAEWALRLSVDELKQALTVQLQPLLPDTIPLPDEQLPRSVGAKWENADIFMPDGSIAHFVEGTKLQDKEVFAGKGCRRKIDVIDRLVSKYPGSAADEWQKVKATATIVWRDVSDQAEIHWYEEATIGKIDFKFKRWKS
nr:MAG TPA: hypothetical protein [Caudoviricetes sp.]